jgi:hypothetical protein
MVVEVKINGLAVDPQAKSHVVLLKEADGERVLPIWIGPAEAQAIARELAGQRFPRPLTHDLLATIVEGLHAKVTRVVIADLKDNTFFASLILERRRGDLDRRAPLGLDRGRAALPAPTSFVDEKLLHEPGEQEEPTPRRRRGRCAASSRTSIRKTSASTTREDSRRVALLLIAPWAPRASRIAKGGNPGSRGGARRRSVTGTRKANTPREWLATRRGERCRRRHRLLRPELRTQVERTYEKSMLMASSRGGEPPRPRDALGRALRELARPRGERRDGSALRAAKRETRTRRSAARRSHGAPGTCPLLESLQGLPHRTFSAAPDPHRTASSRSGSPRRRQHALFPRSQRGIGEQ